MGHYYRLKAWTSRLVHGAGVTALLGLLTGALLVLAAI